MLEHSNLKIICNLILNEGERNEEEKIFIYFNI